MPKNIDFHKFVPAIVRTLADWAETYDAQQFCQFEHARLLAQTLDNYGRRVERTGADITVNTWDAVHEEIDRRRAMRKIAHERKLEKKRIAAAKALLELDLAPALID